MNGTAGERSVYTLRRRDRRDHSATRDGRKGDGAAHRVAAARLHRRYSRSLTLHSHSYSYALTLHRSLCRSALCPVARESAFIDTRVTLRCAVLCRSRESQCGAGCSEWARRRAARRRHEPRGRAGPGAAARGPLRPRDQSRHPGPPLARPVRDARALTVLFCTHCTVYCSSCAYSCRL